jgi:FdhD protein
VLREAIIKKINLSTGEKTDFVDYIAEDKPMHLYVNTTFWATIQSSPENLKELAVGHLLSEGILKGPDEIAEINLKKADGVCYVKLNSDINVDARLQLSRLHARVILTACGSNTPLQFTGKKPIVTSTLTIKAQILSDSVNQLNFKAEGYRKTGGLHVAALYRADGSLVALAEDVGRHNAVDKVIGMAALKKIFFGECFLALSGRISGDVAFKAAKVGLPIVASLSAALSSGINMAETSNLTLVGFVRGKRMNVYTAPDRIEL